MTDRPKKARMTEAQVNQLEYLARANLKANRLRCNDCGITIEPKNLDNCSEFYDAHGGHSTVVIFTGALSR